MIELIRNKMIDKFPIIHIKDLGLLYLFSNVTVCNSKAFAGKVSKSIFELAIL